MPRNRHGPDAWFELAVTTIGDLIRLHGRGAGVRRGRGVTLGLGVGVGHGVPMPLAPGHVERIDAPTITPALVVEIGRAHV